MEPFKFLNNPQVLIYSTVSHKLYGGLGIVAETTDNDLAFIGWLSYKDFPTDYDYDLATPFNDLIVLKK